MCLHMGTELALRAKVASLEGDGCLLLLRLATFGHLRIWCNRHLAEWAGWHYGRALMAI